MNRKRFRFLRTFEANVKAIAPAQNSYQSGHVIWGERSVDAINNHLLIIRSMMMNYK